MKHLHHILSQKRPSKSLTEAKLAAYIIQQFPQHLHHIDEAGNLIFQTCTKSKTLFTSHLDTVHHGEGFNTFIEKNGIIRAENDVLGADDGAGIALMLHMMEHGVPATYIFTRCEERGGKGAKHLASHSAEFLSQFDRAIAFDRRGTSDVITHQAFGRCCSDEFAQALSDALVNDKTIYMPCGGGVYTDTAEFVGIIPECTNLSVGYDQEHSIYESLDLNHLQALAETLLTVNWESLPTVRKAGEVEELTYGGWHYPSLKGSMPDWEQDSTTSDLLDWAWDAYCDKREVEALDLLQEALEQMEEHLDWETLSLANIEDVIDLAYYKAGNKNYNFMSEFKKLVL